MTTRFGVFTEIRGFGIGDPYVDTVKPDPRDHVLNLKVSTCKRGKVRARSLAFDRLPLFTFPAGHCGSSSGAKRPSSPTRARVQNNDATFDKFKPLFEGEKHVDPLRRKLQQAKAGASGNVTDKALKVPSPMKQSACPGDFVGTLGGKVEYKAVRSGERLGVFLAWGWLEEAVSCSGARGVA